MRLKALAPLMFMALCLPGAALGWGDQGHRMIGEEAMRALPDDLPAFLKAPGAIADVGEFSREPDRWRKAGFVHDSERDSAHFIDLYDDGTTFAGVPLRELPRSRYDYDMAVVAKGEKPWRAGYLPYATIDLYQQVVKDMAYWRVLTFLEARESDPAKKAWYQADIRRREQLILRDIGELSHYVGDAQNPMHMSVHYNGWGDFPNPEGFTQEKIHAKLENAYVSANITAEEVRTGMGGYVPCTEAIELCVFTRLERSFGFVIPLYQLEKEGGFAPGDARGIDFMRVRVTQGATDLRDYVVDAWRDSETMTVGWPGNSLADYVTGKVADPWMTLYGE